MAHLVLFQPDARVQARLSDALGSAHRVSTVQSWAALSARVTRDSADGCIVDADHPSREDALEQIRRLRRRHPGLALVAYADVEESDLELYRFGGLGVDGVVLAGRPPRASTIRDALDRSLATARASRVRAAIDGRYPPEAADAVAWAVEHAGRRTSVSAFAAGLGHTPRSLRRLLRECGLPAANRLLLWGRLLLAGAFLGRDGRTVEETAFLLGYSTASALTRAMKRETGHTPGEVARRGGLAFVQGRLFPRGRVRRRRRRDTLGGTLFAVLAALQAAGCATGGPASPADSLREAIDSLLDAPPMDQVHFGVLAVDASSGRVLYERNAGRHFVPASNQKVLVTSAALSLLGPEHRFETALRATGPVVDGSVRGNLVLVGTGDPTLAEPFWPSGEAALAALADSLRASGVHRVEGGLLVDASAWDSSTVGPTWEVEDLRYAYGATGGAFAIDRGEIRVRIRGAPVAGLAPEVSWSPVGTADYVTTSLTTVPADSSTRIRASYLPESRRLALEGHVPAGRIDTLAFAIRDPVRQAAATLARVLEERGIHVAGGWAVAWERGANVGGGCVAGSVERCPSATRVATLGSPPLIEIVEAILEPSQNWMTEQLLRALGERFGGRGSWAAGVDAVHGFLRLAAGVDSLDLAPRDGSGLSAYNLVTPRAMVRILQYMAAGPCAEAYRHAMAEPGEEDSTLEGRLADLEGRVFAKTGTISNVNSLSGYLVREDGREAVFSILSNGSGLPSSRVRATLDEVVKALAGER